MKKGILLVFAAIALSACSVEDTFEETPIQEVDLTSIVQPETAIAETAFDNSVKGIYRGVVTTNDISYHGVLTVNIGNDAKFNAVLVSTTGSRMGFIQSPVDAQVAESDVYTFVNPTSRFTIDLTDFNNPVMLNVNIQGTDGRSKVLKENSGSRMQIRTGTYADDVNAANFGTWDIMSVTTDVILIPTDFGFDFPLTVNVIDAVNVVRNGGAMFTDTTQENFTPSATCIAALPALPAGSRAPFFTNVENLFGTDINEILSFGQASNFGGAVTWDFAYSLAGGDTYFDNDCGMTTNGTWTGPNSSGTLLRD